MIHGTVLARVVDRLIALGVDDGVSRAVLLGAAGVADVDLEHPDVRLPAAAEIALWQTLAEHISDPGFGVRAGAAFRLRSAGLLGYVASFSGTLGGALRRVQRYGRVLTAAVEFRLEEGLPEVVLSMEQPARGPGQALAQDYRLAAVLQASRELSEVEIVPRAVGFTHPRPSSTSAHRQHFRCPLRFGAPRASLHLRASDLDIPLRKADEALAGYLSDYAEQVLTSLVEGGSVRHSVRAAIWSLLGDGKPSLDRVAATLHVSRRTLQRRLAVEGTSLSQEIDAVRQTMAEALLSDRSVPVEEVAFLLGYAEPSTFYRSFKRWTDTTPRGYRSKAA